MKTTTKDSSNHGYFPLPKDRQVSEYLLQISKTQGEIDSLRLARNEMLVKRMLLLYVARQIIINPLKKEKLNQRYHRQRNILIDEQKEAMKQLEAKGSSVISNIEQALQEAEQADDDDQVYNLDQRIELTQKYNTEQRKQLRDQHHQARLALKAAHEKALSSIRDLKDTKEQKIQRVSQLVCQAVLLAEGIQQQNRNIAARSSVLHSAVDQLSFHTKTEALKAHTNAEPKAFVPRELPTVWQAQIKPRATKQEINTILTAVGEGDMETVKACLIANKQVLYARGTLTDVADRTFTDVTVFQYALWAGDIPMCQLILEYLPQRDAAYQMNTLKDHRPDIKKTHGTYFSFEATNQAYKTYCDSYNGWNVDQCHQYWCETIGGFQKTWPAWVRFKMTEEGSDVAWTKQDAAMSYARSLKCRRAGKDNWTHDSGNNLGAVSLSNKGFAWGRGKTHSITSFHNNNVLYHIHFNHATKKAVHHDLQCLNNEQPSIVRYRETLEANFSAVSHSQGEKASQAPRQ